MGLEAEVGRDDRAGLLMQVGEPGLSVCSLANYDKSRRSANAPDPEANDRNAMVVTMAGPSEDWRKDPTYGDFRRRVAERESGIECPALAAQTDADCEDRQSDRPFQHSLTHIDRQRRCLAKRREAQCEQRRSAISNEPRVL